MIGSATKKIYSSCLIVNGRAAASDTKSNIWRGAEEECWHATKSNYQRDANEVNKKEGHHQQARAREDRLFRRQRQHTIHNRRHTSRAKSSKLQDFVDGSAKATMSRNNKGRLIRIGSYVIRKKGISRNQQQQWCARHEEQDGQQGQNEDEVAAELGRQDQLHVRMEGDLSIGREERTLFLKQPRRRIRQVTRLNNAWL